MTASLLISTAPATATGQPPTTYNCMVCKAAVQCQPPGGRYCDQCGHPTASMALGYGIGSPSGEIAAEVRKAKRMKDPSAHKLRAMAQTYGIPDLYSSTSVHGARRRTQTTSRCMNRRSLPPFTSIAGTGGVEEHGHDDDTSKRCEAIISRHHMQQSERHRRETLLRMVEASNVARYQSSLATVDQWTDEVRAATRDRLRRALDFRPLSSSSSPPPRIAGASIQEDVSKKQAQQASESCSTLAHAEATPSTAITLVEENGEASSQEIRLQRRPVTLVEEKEAKSQEIRLRPQDLERRPVAAAAHVCFPTPPAADGRMATIVSEQQLASPKSGDIQITRSDLDAKAAWFWGSLRKSTPPISVFWGSAYHGAAPETDGEGGCEEAGQWSEDGGEEEEEEGQLQGHCTEDGSASAAGLVTATSSGAIMIPSETSRGVQYEDPSQPQVVVLPGLDEAELNEKESGIFSDLAVSRMALEQALKAEARMYELLKQVTVAGALKKSATALTVASAQEAVAKSASILFRIEKALTHPMSNKQRRVFELRRIMADEQFQSANSVLAKAITEEARVGRYHMKAALRAGEAHLDTEDKEEAARTTAATCIQAIIRGFLARCTARRLRLVRRYKQRKSAATVLQARVRRMKVKAQYRSSLTSIIKGQAMVRGWIAARRAKKLKLAREREEQRRRWEEEEKGEEDLLARISSGPGGEDMEQKSRGAL